MLRRGRVVPGDRWHRYGRAYRQRQLSNTQIASIRDSSRWAASLPPDWSMQLFARRERGAIEEEHQVVHELERYLNTLGTIASIAPFWGFSERSSV